MTITVHFVIFHVYLILHIYVSECCLIKSWNLENNDAYEWQVNHVFITQLNYYNYFHMIFINFVINNDKCFITITLHNDKSLFIIFFFFINSDIWSNTLEYDNFLYPWRSKIEIQKYCQVHFQHYRWINQKPLFLLNIIRSSYFN